MEYQVIRSKRKTISLEITPFAQILVRAPLRMSQKRIDTFVLEHTDWIEKHLQKVRMRQQMQTDSQRKKLTEEDIKLMAQKAAVVLTEKCAIYAEKMCVSYHRVTIRCQKTRWGSCSEKGNLNFNCLLLDTPEQVQDYVVIHELCHRKEMNHSAAFWKEVENMMPDYRIWRQWLKEHGGSVIDSVNHRGV